MSLKCVRALAVAIACLVIVGERAPSALQQLILPAAWEFRKGASRFAEWDIWHPPTGKVGASFSLQASASPPDGLILHVVTFDNYAEIVALVSLVLDGIDATGLTVTLERERVTPNARLAYRDMLALNEKTTPDPTTRRLFATTDPRVHDPKNEKTVYTFRLPPPPITYELTTGLRERLLPNLRLKLTANGATVAASLDIP